MTDWGVHLIDPIHQCFGEPMPRAISALGSKFYVQDNTETPDTMLATFHYENFLGSYESRTCNPLPMFGIAEGGGTVVHGTEASVFVSRSGCHLIPNDKSKQPEVWANDPAMSAMNVPHWQNFVDCIKTRQKPISDIETCVRSSTACLLANVSLRFKSRIDWDEENWSCSQDEMKSHLNATYRAPWKLEV
jgi:predicted dehydrogenase